MSVSVTSQTRDLPMGGASLMAVWLAGATTTLAARDGFNSLQAIQGAMADPNGMSAAQAANVSVSITVGGSESQSETKDNATMQAGSHITAGGKVNILAQGAGMDNDITVLGSDIYGQGNVTIKSDGTMNLKAASDTHDSERDSSSMSGGVGVAITYGQSGFAFGVTANASGSRGNGTGHDVTWNNSHVGSGGKLTIESGGDADFSGAVLKGQQVGIDVGGNAIFASLQDTSQFKSKDESIGGSVTVGYGFAGSISASQQQVNGDYASVREQAGVMAGDGGFQINVKGNTLLDGAILASSQDAIDNKRNTFTTGTLTTKDIENYSNYDASGFSLSGGYSVDMGGSKKPADGQSTATKTDWQTFDTGPQGGGAGFGEKSGSDKSITRSGISGAQITITDEEGQKALTGKDAAETIASLNRDVTSDTTSNGLTKNWDGDKLNNEISASMQITSSFGQVAGTAIGSYADDQMRKAQENGDQEAYDNWKEGGAYRVALHAAGASAAAPTLNEFQKSIAQNLEKAGANDTLAQAVAQIISGATATGIGAAVSGGSVAGAATAYNADTNNRLLVPEQLKIISDISKGDAEKAQLLTAVLCRLQSCPYDGFNGKTNDATAQAQYDQGQQLSISNPLLFAQLTDEIKQAGLLSGQYSYAQGGWDYIKDAAGVYWQPGKNAQIQTGLGYTLGVGASIGSLYQIATPDFWNGIGLLVKSDHPMDMMALAIKAEAQERRDDFNMYAKQGDDFGAGMVVGRTAADVVMLADGAVSLASLSTRVANAGGRLVAGGYEWAIQNGKLEITGSAISNIYATTKPAEDVFPELKGVNPYYVENAMIGTNTNCVSCVNAAQARLLGQNPNAVASPSSGYANMNALLPSAPFGFAEEATTPASVIAEMQLAGNGAARPLVIIQPGTTVRHVINVVNRDGQIYFIDSQMGKLVTLQPNIKVLLGKEP